MKKLFFFKSFSSASSEPSLPTDTKANRESSLENKLRNQSRDEFKNIFQNSNEPFSKVQKPTVQSCRHSSASAPRLRRSLSFSSVAFSGNDGLEQSMSPSSSSSSIPPQEFKYSSCCQPLTPEKQFRAKPYELAPAEIANQIENARSSCFYGDQNDSSQNSSTCSSNVSSSALDLYIDGEQKQERSRPKNNPPKRNHVGNRIGSGKRPPRVQHTAPTSPINDVKGRPRSRLFTGHTQTHAYFPSKEFSEGQFMHESLQDLSKHVIEKLSQSHISSETSLKEFDPDTPITIEEVYDKSSHRGSAVISAQAGHKNLPLDEPCEAFNVDYPEEPFSFQKPNYFSNEGLVSVDQEDTSEELQRKFKEAEARVFYLSEEIRQESFLRDCGYDVPSLVQGIRVLAEERVSLALEVSTALQGQIEERTSAKEKLRLAKVELGARSHRLEKEKNELQAALEKELDRRSSDWSYKLEKYQSEEQRLRERVRELAEQNVSLQREVSSFNENVSQVGDLTSKLEEVRRENQDLRQSFYCLQEKYLVAEEGRGCIQRNYEEKEKECCELQSSIARLLRTCNEQEKTIGGLREGFNEEIEMKQSSENFDKIVGKLQMEQLRLAGVEQALRREVESYRSEVDSIRHENINLLNRLKMAGKEGGFSTFKLDQELGNRVCCLESQGRSLLNDSNQLCSNLLEFIKVKCAEATKDGLVRQFIVESDAKVQGFKRGTENLARSSQIMSDLLHEKSNLVNLEYQPHSTKDVQLEQSNNDNSEEIIRSELKAEYLVTRALRDKLLSKQMDVEQLQAELAAAVRGNEILRFEVQNARDTLSCATHKSKDLELQLLKKDENINRLENDLRESMKESTVMRGMLPKVSHERDVMWEEVKQYSEKNMLLNSEVNALKKKIEQLDEEVLVKEGQITILKDGLRNGAFSLLASPDPTREFLLE